MAKARFYGENKDYLAFYCAGCKHTHAININPANGEPCWTFNGDMEKPTISPSVLNRTGHHVTGQPQPPNCRHCNDPDFIDKTPPCTICHIFVTDGKIQFLNDCTHILAGKTLDLEEIRD